MSLRAVLTRANSLQRGVALWAPATTNGSLLTCCPRCLSTQSSKGGVGNAGAEKAEKISMAMKAYLERAQGHEAFMQHETSEYQVGKRHLANIMGCDPENFTQEDIDTAIQYLLPSGLFDKRARPIMKLPEDVIPQRKAAQFGIDGRPFHSMFYSGNPNFYKLMHDLAVSYEELKVIADEMSAKEMKPLQRLTLGTSVWVDKLALEKSLQESLSEIQYQQFLTLGDALVNEPFSYRIKDVILRYRKVLHTQAMLQEVPEAKTSADSDRLYQEAEGKRKAAEAKVTVWDKGSGEVTINGTDMLTYFPDVTDREQLLFPLQMTGCLGEVDVEARVEGGGPSGQAGAIRLAMAFALQSFVSKETVEKMRLAGLLTLDPRRRERKKPGQEKARKKFTWKKR